LAGGLEASPSEIDNPELLLYEIQERLIGHLPNEFDELR
jgi:hypothetical protein